MLPTFLIIGAARCGTTWLARNLMMHPEIFMHEKKELHFFDWYYDKGIEWYEREFAGVCALAIGEATPAYLYHEHIARLIEMHIPEIKLIVSLRDPVDRAYSAYRFREKERQAQKVTVTFDEKVRAGSRAISEGLYAANLQRYYDLFEKASILVVLYDELENNPFEYLRRVHSFLGVSDDFRSPLVDKKVNSSLTKAELLRQLRSGNVGSKVDAKGVNNATRKRLLHDYYIEDIQKLEGMIHQDLTEWKQSEK